MKQDPRIRRTAASEYLERVHGIKQSPATLAAKACRGQGPEIEYVNRIPFHRLSALDAYAKAVVSKPTKQARKYAQPRNQRHKGDTELAAHQPELHTE
jgi:hypothetical protein